jgi:hypothetical protein
MLNPTHAKTNTPSTKPFEPLNDIQTMMNDGKIIMKDVMCHINSLIQTIAVAFAVEAPLVFNQNKIYGSIINGPGVIA